MKIADFGIARAYNALRPAADRHRQGDGARRCTWRRSRRTDDPLGPQTDLDALGVIATSCSPAGRLQSDTPWASSTATSTSPRPRSPGSLSPPRAVRGWVEWLLEKAPAERPQSAGEAWQALEEVAVAEWPVLAPDRDDHGAGAQRRRGPACSAREGADDGGPGGAAAADEEQTH